MLVVCTMLMMKLRSVLIELTNGCTMATCLHCSSNSRHTLSGKCAVIPLHTFLKLMRSLLDCGVREVEISGGEPLTCPHHLLHLLGFARDFPDVRFKIFTNLVPPSPEALTHLVALSRLDNVEVHFPLHGDAAVHSFVVGNKHHFATALRIAKLLLSHGAQLCVNTLVSRYVCSYEQLTRLLKLCESTGIQQVSLLRLVPHGRALRNLEVLQPRLHDYINLLEALRQIDREGCFEVSIRLGCPVAPRRITLRSSIFKTSTVCLSGRQHICVLPDGMVIPCVAYKGAAHIMSIGVVSKSGELELSEWCLSKYHSYKHSVKSRCYCPAQYLYWKVDHLKIAEELLVETSP